MSFLYCAPGNPRSTIDFILLKPKCQQSCSLPWVPDAKSLSASRPTCYLWLIAPLCKQSHMEASLTPPPPQLFCFPLLASFSWFLWEQPQSEKISPFLRLTIIKFVKFPLLCKGHTQRGQRLRGLQELLFCLLQQLYPAWPWQWWGASPFLCKSVIDNAGEIALRVSLTIWTVTSHCLGRTLVLTWRTHSSP